VIDFDALASARLSDDPYKWALVDRAVEPGDALTLLERFPDSGYWQITGDDGEKRYTYAARPLVTLGASHAALVGPLDPAWQQVAADLVSPEYRRSLGHLIGRSLDDCLMEASVWRWDAAAHLGAHLDMDTKVVTHVFYFSHRWETDWGGCLRILNSQDTDDVVAEIPPRLGTASVLVRSDRSWHAVSPVDTTAAEPRRSLIVTWFAPGAVSPVWQVDESGAVHCPVGEPERQAA
jgi:hypothetical protein